VLSKPVESELESLRVLSLECSLRSGLLAVSMAGMPRLRWLCMKGMIGPPEVLPNMTLQLQASAGDKLLKGVNCSPPRATTVPSLLLPVTVLPPVAVSRLHYSMLHPSTTACPQQTNLRTPNSTVSAIHHYQAA
jgi:hypothetical protein